MLEIYLDNNATTRPLSQVAAKVAHVLTEGYGNPSSPHSRGAIARQTLFEARMQVANLLGCSEEKIIFTSGGTEANNLILKSFFTNRAEARLVVSAVEHSSVLKVADDLQARGVSVEVLPVDDKGRVSVEALENALKRRTSLVSIQYANSETGVIQPVEQLGSLCLQHGVPLHVDAAQAVGRVAFNFESLPIDYLTLTAHKLHGPQGVGAIAFNGKHNLVADLGGGDQEYGVRPGTENLPGIAGFGVAAKLRKQIMPDCINTLRGLRDAFEQKVLANVPGAVVNGDVDNRTANSTSIFLPGVDGMAMMAQLDNEDVYCSLTSACVSARPQPSHVLRAMGLSETEAFSSLRFSFSVFNTEKEAGVAADKVAEIYARLADNTQQQYG